MTTLDSDLVTRIQDSLGIELEFSTQGRPKIVRPPLGSPKWPHKLDPLRAVVMDTTPTDDGEFWPTPRFEILIANLDSVGISVVQVGDPSSEFLARANHHFKKLSSADRAGVISMSLLWIGMNTPWRYVAAALGKPQIVIAASKSQVEPNWPDTFVVDASAHAPESKALGPISVTSVAEAVSTALKKFGANPAS